MKKFVKKKNFTIFKAIAFIDFSHENIQQKEIVIPSK